MCIHKNGNDTLYIEHITLHAFSLYVIPFLIKQLFKKNNGVIYFFSCPKYLEKCAIIFFKDVLRRFDYEIDTLEIKDNNGECITSNIERKDAILFVEKITNSTIFKEFINDNENINNFSNYLIKSIAGGNSPIEYRNIKSLYYNLLLIRKVHEHNKLLGINKSVFVFLNRPWFEHYKEYGLFYCIKILKSYQIKLNIISILKTLLVKNSHLALSLKYVRNYFKYNLHIKYNKYEKEDSIKRVLFEGLGEFNLEKNGYNSDFFFYLYSPLESRYLSSFYETYEQRNLLIKEGIKPIYLYEKSYKIKKIKEDKNPIKNTFIEEKSFISKTIDEYLLSKLEWRNIFVQQNIKLFLTWYKFDSNHISKHDAINEIGGVSAVWDRSFEGEANLDYMTVSDINFTFSDYNYFNHHSSIYSNISYNVITGYLRDYSKLYRSESLKVMRQRLRKNGAELIISVFDQNSAYPHTREKESYKCLLNFMFENKWLGIVFKPKKPKTLRKRLGNEISELIDEAIITGRCHIFEESGNYQSNVPVIFASVIGDICIHNALYAGTAALECALTGKPTILLDTVGYPYSRLYEHEKDRVIFSNINDVISILIDYYNHPKSIVGLGDWSKTISNYDPFHDGKGAYRMGSFLQSVMTGFEKKMKRSDVLERAAEIYCKEWGSDKIIRGNKLLN